MPMGLGNGSLDLLFIIPLALSLLLLHGVLDGILGHRSVHRHNRKKLRIALVHVI